MSRYSLTGIAEYGSTHITHTDGSGRQIIGFIENGILCRLNKADDELIIPLSEVDGHYFDDTRWTERIDLKTITYTALRGRKITIKQVSRYLIGRLSDIPLHKMEAVKRAECVWKHKRARRRATFRISHLEHLMEVVQRDMNTVRFEANQQHEVTLDEDRQYRMF